MNSTKDDTDSDVEDDDEEGSSSDEEQDASGDVDEAFRAELQAALGPAVVDVNKEVRILCQSEGCPFFKTKWKGNGETFANILQNEWRQEWLDGLFISLKEEEPKWLIHR